MVKMIKPETIRELAQQTLNVREIIVREVRGSRGYEMFIDFRDPSGGQQTLVSEGSTTAIARKRMIERLHKLKLISRIEAERSIRDEMERMLRRARPFDLSHMLQQIDEEDHEYLVF